MTTDFKLSLYKKMLFYRKFEEKVNLAYTKQKFSGFCHLHIGQEAVAAGMQACLQGQDYVISSYRSHTQAIAKGISPESVMAELFGKIDGCSRGKGGSMHMFSHDKRFLGGHGIVGGQAPLAVGAAFTAKFKGENSIVVCYLGDAAMNQGQVFEAMNMAATWELPVLFVIENNRYGMGTDIKRTTSIEKMSQRALAFEMDHSQVNGMDVLEYYEHVKPIVEKMRVDRKPYLLDALTYRYKGHSVSDPATYRSKQELESYQKNDPILTLANHLQSEGILTEELKKEIEIQTKTRLKEVEKFADESPVPDVKVAFEDVFVE